MALPVRLSTHSPASRWVAALLVGALATALGVAAHQVPGASLAMSRLDETLYDAFYHLRQSVDRSTGNIVIVAVDDASLANMARNHRYWPWPRDYWGLLLQYMQKCGARAVVFDLIFTEPSALSQFMDDDAHFAEALDQARVPVVMATIATDKGTAGPFAIPVQKPVVFGAVNLLNDKVVRSYASDVHEMPSLAERVMQVIGAPIPAWGNEPFRLHYYGPNRRPDGRTTFNYLSAAYVFADAAPQKKGKPPRAPAIDPNTFKDKVVLVGAISVGTYDLKSSPLSGLYPGVEVQATAIENLLGNQRVTPMGDWASLSIIFMAALLSALGVTLPRGVGWKILCAAIASAALFGAAAMLFTRADIRWLPMSSPIVALLLSILGAFAWTYLVEQRQHRFFVKALQQYLSPEVAAEIQRDPSKLKLGGQRREMTVMFSDIQGFTTLSETMPSEQLSTLLNYYLGEMSSLILNSRGTIDKYIGDAIMSFWNAPLHQPDHAISACRAALQMRQREAEIQPTLRSMGAPELITRIGINTGPMAFGNMGSPQKFNYSVLGDAVNLGSRLEGANKFYNSRILLAQSTVDSIGKNFVVRQLDLLAVKGKTQPMAVYELLAESPGDSDLLARVELYERALELYRGQKWDDAQEVLRAAHARFPDDAPVLALSARIDYLRLHPPVAAWDGVYVAKDK